jgi:hypothetical protein
MRLAFGPGAVCYLDGSQVRLETFAASRLIAPEFIRFGRGACLIEAKNPSFLSVRP